MLLKVRSPDSLCWVLCLGLKRLKQSVSESGLLSGSSEEESVPKSIQVIGRF